MINRLMMMIDISLFHVNGDIKLDANTKNMVSSTDLDDQRGV